MTEEGTADLSPIDQAFMANCFEAANSSFICVASKVTNPTLPKLILKVTYTTSNAHCNAKQATIDSSAFCTTHRVLPSVRGNAECAF